MPLVIVGRDGYFSAGFDLKVMRSGDRDLVSSLAGQGILLFREIFAAPIPVVAAGTGHALAAGALLLLAADYRIGRPGTYQVGLNETRIGIALPQFAIDITRYRLSTNHLVEATTFAAITGPRPGLCLRLSRPAGGRSPCPRHAPRPGIWPRWASRPSPAPSGA